MKTFDIYYCYGGREIGETKLHQLIEVSDNQDERDAKRIFEENYNYEVIISIEEL